jgi:DNA primase
MSLVNHPQIFHEHGDLLTELRFDSRPVAELYADVLDIFAAGAVETREDMLRLLSARDRAVAVEALSRQIRGCYHWVAAEGAAIEDVREAFRQTLALHTRARALAEQRAALQAALAEAIEEGSDGVADHLVLSLRHNAEEMAAFERQEALVDGFGVLSGRAAG